MHISELVEFYKYGGIMRYSFDNKAGFIFRLMYEHGFRRRKEAGIFQFFKITDGTEQLVTRNDLRKYFYSILDDCSIENIPKDFDLKMVKSTVIEKGLFGDKELLKDYLSGQHL